MSEGTGWLERGRRTCPTCGEGLDGWLNTQSERGPKRGDMVVCSCCRALLAYGPGALTVDLISQEELDALPEDKKERIRVVREFLKERYGGEDRGQTL